MLWYSPHHKQSAFAPTDDTPFLCPPKSGWMLVRVSWNPLPEHLDLGCRWDIFLFHENLHKEWQMKTLKSQEHHAASYPKPPSFFLYSMGWCSDLTLGFFGTLSATANTQQLGQAQQDATLGAPNPVHLMPHLLQTPVLRGERQVTDGRPHSQSPSHLF